MTDSEKLDLLLSEMSSLKSDMSSLKSDVQSLKSDMAYVKLHIENRTDKNIQILAENFIELTKKLNQAIPVANNNRTYEIKVDYLTDRVDKLV